MMRVIFYFMFFCALLSCSRRSSVPDNPIAPPSNLLPPVVGEKTFLALGDSYTIGQGVEAAARFPAQTVALLRQMGISVSDPVYIAQTGWTTRNLQTAITSQNPPSSFDAVSLLIGVNDQYQGMDTTFYAVQFTQLLEKAIRLARGTKKHVFVLSIPDYSVTPFIQGPDKGRVRKEIDSFNAVNKRITDGYGISYTDITTSTREADSNTSLLAGDGLHPSDTEYRKWAELLAPKFRAVLQ